MALSIVLLALGLRLYRVGAPSLSVDEIISMYQVGSGIRELLDVAGTDVHPPLYFLLLWGWRHLAGSSEFAVRFFSGMPAVAAVALTYALGRRIFGSGVGLMASLGSAISPFLVHYSQEVRMYSLVLAVGLASVYVLSRALERWRFLWWAAWAVLTVIAILIDYTAVPILAVADGMLLWRLYRRRGRWWWSIVAAHVVAAALVVPWLTYLPVARRALGQYTETGTSLRYVLERTAVSFGGVAGLPGEVAVTLIVVLGVLVVLGATRADVPAERRGLLLLFLLLPIVMAYAFATRGRDFAPRYVIVAVPPFLIMVAAGVAVLARLWKPLLSVGVLAFLLPNAISLHREYYDPPIQRDDIRGMAKWLDERMLPDDVVVFVAGPGQTMYPYYGTQSIRAVGLPEEQPLDQDKTAERLSRLQQDYERVWLVLLLDELVDPGRFVEKWLLSNSNLIDSVALPGLEVEGFDTRPLRRGELPRPAYPTSVSLGGVVRLWGGDVDEQALADRGLLFVTLYWESLAPMEESYWVFVHLVDSEGRRWAQKDNRPGYDQLHTNLWKPGDVVRDEYRLLAKEKLPPGRYRVLLGMYGPGGKRLQSSEGEDSVVLAEVQVGP